MDSQELFRRFQAAMQLAEQRRLALQRTRHETEHLVAESTRLGMDIQLIATATFQRRLRPARAGSQDHHLTAHLAAVTAVDRWLAAGAESLTLPDYISQVCRGLPKPKYQDPRIRLDIECDPLKLDAGNALRLGLITSELVMNAYDHAFFLERRGSIRIAASGSRGRIAAFSVSDSGSGYPAARRRGPGLLMVESLAGLMGADVTYREGRHAAASLTFRGFHRSATAGP